ncbi:MAG: hypothetical protein US50_C0009G0014, partial [Candidatus Nomurabacteria bacterium GW2011_GWB1_37_5]
EELILPHKEATRIDTEIKSPVPNLAEQKMAGAFSMPKKETDYSEKPATSPQPSPKIGEGASTDEPIVRHKDRTDPYRLPPD